MPRLRVLCSSTKCRRQPAILDVLRSSLASVCHGSKLENRCKTKKSAVPETRIFPFLTWLLSVFPRMLMRKTKVLFCPESAVLNDSRIP